MKPEFQLRPIQKLTKPFQHFFHLEASGGIVLLACTSVALLIANSSFASPYYAFWNQILSFTIGESGVSYPLWYWVNDGLMVIFFFVIGLELKRELTIGELSEKNKITLPVAAAIGGAIAPVIIFLMLQHGEPAQNGWAIPMATDIAFVVGVLSILGNRVPHSLKIFLLSVAIVDDLLAISVIAIFFTDTIHLIWLVMSLCGFGVILLMNKLGVRYIASYVLVGCFIWFFTLKSGIHPTIAGVILGLMTPATSLLDRKSAQNALESLGSIFSYNEQKGIKGAEFTLSREAQFTSRESISPLERLETALHPWVVFVIMPIFALANAAVLLDISNIKTPLSVAIILGLIMGKPLGILLSSFLVIRIGWTKLPESVSWSTMIGAGLLAGIGFTMSLFIASLALEESLLRIAKGGILIGSGVSMILGFGFLLISLKKRKPKPHST